jgi:enterochelin esterase-like enzyme
MRLARIVLAGAAVVLTAAIGVAMGRSDHPAVAIPAPSLAQFHRVARGARRGAVLSGPVPGVGQVAVYLPGHLRRLHGLSVVRIPSHGRPGALARRIGLAGTADQLAWDGTTRPFVAVVARTSSTAQLRRLMAWTEAVLPVAPTRVWPSVAPRGRALAAELTALLQTAAARAASRAATGMLPRGFRSMLAGPAGGTVWQGRIPGAAVPGLRRQSLVYLPPNVDRHRRYPLVILLHGLRGSPFSFSASLRIAAAVDPLIAGHRLAPFIAVMPPAGYTPAFDGEWTGAWERYVVRDIVPWASAHLPVRRTASGRTIAGYSAGGYGAVDIALRHPRVFGVAESWSGYFDAPRDGSLRGASRAARAAHSPTDLVERDRVHRVRFLLSAGTRERVVLRATRRFGRELRRLHLPVRVLITHGRHDGRQWHAVLGPGLVYALGSGPIGR